MTSISLLAIYYAEKNNIVIEGLEKPVSDIGEKEEAPEEEY